MAIALFAICFGMLAREAWGQIEILQTENAFAPILRLDTTFYQVRIDQRVIIRLPSQLAAPADVAAARNRQAAVRYKEQKIGKCLWIDKLAGSRPGPNRTLDIATRDGVLIRAYLGDGCLAREFYAGAYLERPYDGKLCVDRDLLHARTGAKCEVDRFRLLVPR
jgi:hypothetical protein